MFMVYKIFLAFSFSVEENRRMISPGDDCFIRYRGRVWRGRVRHVFQETFGEVAHVTTDAAPLCCAKWRNLGFWIATMRGTFAKDAELIVPESIADMMALAEAADSKVPVVDTSRRVMAAERPRPVKPAPVQAVMKPPYADDDDDSRVMSLPEGFEPGETL